MTRDAQLGWTRVALPFALSLTPCALAWWRGATFEHVSMFGLMLVPWVAVAGWPGGSRAMLAPSVCAAWPVLALGAALDARAGASRTALGAASVWAVAVLCALAWCATQPRRRRALSLYELAWLALLVAPVTAGFAFEFSLGRRVAPRLVAAFSEASPLGWACSQARALARAPDFFPWSVCIATLLLVLAALADARRADA